MSMKIERSLRSGRFEIKLQGIRGKISADTLEEVVISIAHYFGLHTTRIPSIEVPQLHNKVRDKCPLCRER